MYKKVIEGKKAAFFDLDGTIADTEPIWLGAVVHVLEKHSGKVEEARGIITERGRSLREKLNEILKKQLIDRNSNIDLLIKETNESFLEFLKQITLEPREGFWELAYSLKENKGFKLALTTNTSKATAWEILNHLGIEKTFDLYLCGDEVSRPKPDPEIYIKAASTLNLKPAEVIVFEDSPSGASAANKVGMSLIVIWDEETDKSKFPGKTLLFMPTFEGLVSNLDHTFEEAFRDFQNRLKDK